MYRASNLKCIKTLDKELEELKLEKDGLDEKLEGLLKASKNLDNVIESQRSDKKDLSWTGLPEFVDDTVTDYSRPSPTVASTSTEGPEFVFKKKACYNYGDFSHLANDCRKRVQRETSRSQNHAYMGPSHRSAGHRPHGPSMNPIRPNMNGTESYAEQAFWSQYSVQTDEPTHFGTTIVKVPKELPKVSMELFTSFDQYLIDEVTEVQKIFKQMEIAVEQHYVEKTEFQTKMENVLKENDRLLTHALGVEIVNIVRDTVSSSKSAPTLAELFETNELKAQIQEKDTVILKLKEKIKSSSGDVKERKGSSQNNIDDKGYWDSGCSRHMTGNISYLSDFEPFDGGYVSFGQGGCKIIGKGTIKTDKLKFENIYFVKDLKHNLVRGLPAKCFENDHTCTACLKGKQNKASCKSKLVNSVSKPLHTLHRDLFGPTSVSSIGHKWYCLVVTDDFSRFTWTFFLKTKDETSGIFRKFITEIENLKDQKVKIIRCDNGGEFRNKEMNDFCSQKGIRRKFSNARTPQQNGVAEKRNKTLIEAARTMLANAKLPVTFWAEAVNTAYYVQNKVLVNKSQNKTPYELFNGRTPAIGFLKPFSCHVMILNTLGNLGKFEAKGDEGYFIGYSMSSKAFRVFNKRTKKVEQNLHVEFLENKAIEKGAGPNWLFDIDSLTKSMNYVPVDAGTNSTNLLGTKDATSQEVKKDVSSLRYITLPNWVYDALLESSSENLKMIAVLMFLKEVLKNKKDERGIVIRNKARLVVRGHTQEERIDYDEVFAPVARIESIRLFLAYASFMGFIVYQMDVKSAFLYGTIDEEVYVMQPLRFQDPEFQ
nr:retrovirus-related Pol polyprotein from transposon TNT 1-94 [Tanacetum cinerariifolium]